MDSTSDCHISQLPDCVLEQIFLHLCPGIQAFPYPVDSLEHILSSVCPQWAIVLSNSSKLWPLVSLQIPSDMPVPSDFFTTLYRMSPSVRYLTISGSVDTISTRAFLKFPIFKNVEYLHFNVGPKLTPMEWSLVVELFPNLEEFVCQKHYHHLGDRTLQLFATGWPNLNSIEIRNCRRLTGAGLINFFTVANRVQKIDMDGIPNVTDGDMETITRLLGKSLKSITFGRDQYQLSGLTIKSLAQNCPQLNDISISNRMSITHLKDCVNLRSLAINFSMRPSHCAELEEIFSRPFGDLRVLEIDNAENVTDSQLVKIANSCRLLKDLYLLVPLGYNNRLVTDLGLDQIVNKCSNLTQLDVERFQLLTGRSFVGNRAKLPQLRDLRLVGCPNVDEGAIRAEFAGVEDMTIDVE